MSDDIWILALICAYQATLELAGACMRADQSVRKRIELENGVPVLILIVIITS